MLDRLDALARRYDELEHEMARAAEAGDFDRVAELARERADLEQVYGRHREYRRVLAELEDAEALAGSGEPEMAELARAEMPGLKEQRDRLEVELRRLMLPRDPNDDKDVFIEIRAGAGGDEAGLFAAELYRMYTRYAERQGWKTEINSLSESEAGGVKEIIFEVKGQGAYSHLKYEAGVHRVQRVPVTESGGRIHTSTATVAVLPEADEVDVQIPDSDVEIQVYRSSGHGGQSVNTTDSAVRLIHKPTGMVVTNQDEKSQLKNKIKAMAVLRARLFEQEMARRQAELGAERLGQVGTGDRSEKIRTYNFPQDRVTDHRVKMSLSNLPAVMDGAIQPLIQELQMADQSARLQALGLDGQGA